MTAGRLRAAYYNSATFGSPTWVLIDRISDVSRSRSRGTSDRKYRAASNSKKVTGYLEYGFSFKYHVKKAVLSDTVLDKLEDSFLNETVLDFCFLNGKIASGTTRKGERGPVVVSKLDISEADEDGVTYDVELVETEDEQSGALNEFKAYTVTTA
jgi:hypothetical protein